MEDIFTILLFIFVMYVIYKYTRYKKIKTLPPCKLVYKIEEKKCIINIMK